MLKDEPIASTTTSTPGTTSSDNDRYYKEYVRVDLRQTPFKCLPDDITDNKPITIKGTSLVQIEDIEIIESKDIENNKKLNTEANDESSSSLPVGTENLLELTITDGFTTLRAITTEQISGLTIDTVPGSKLTLFNVIPIKSNVLQLSNQNCRWINGSRTYSTPKPYYRGDGSRRGGEGYRTFDARRRYQDDDEHNYMKKPLPLSLFSFVGPKFQGLNMSDEPLNSKQQASTSQQDTDSKRDNYPSTKPSFHSNKAYGNSYRNNRYSSSSSSSQHNNNIPQTGQKTPATDSSTTESRQINSREKPYRNNYDTTSSNYPRTQQQQNNRTDTHDFQQQQIYRERRNPLPPRLQRVQEERSRRNTNRYYDDSSYDTAGEGAPSSYDNGDTDSHRNSGNTRRPYRNQIGSSNQLSYPHNTVMISGGNGQTVPSASSIANNFYFPNTTMNSAAYSFAAAAVTQTGAYQQVPYNCTSNDQFAYCYSIPKEAIYPTGLHPSMWTAEMVSANSVPLSNSNDPNNGAYYNVQTQSNSNSSNGVTNAINSINTKANYNNNDTVANPDQPSSSTDERQPQHQQQQPQQFDNKIHDAALNQQDFKTNNNEKRRDSNSNSRAWQIGDFCMARWKDDGQFYYANIVEIQPTSCLVLFKDYNNYEQVSFNDLKLIPRDQLQHLIANQMTTLHPDAVNRLIQATSLYCRPTYPNDGTINYTSSSPNTVIMPEAPPFPFNSTGNLIVCAPPRTVRSSNNGYYNKLAKSKQNNNSVQQQEQLDKQLDENINGANTEQSSFTNVEDQTNNFQSKQDENTTPLDYNEESKDDDIKQQVTDTESGIENTTTTTTSEPTTPKRTRTTSSASSSHGRSTSTASIDSSNDHFDEISNVSTTDNKAESQQIESTGDDNQEEENVSDIQMPSSTNQTTSSKSIAVAIEDPPSQSKIIDDEINNPDGTKIKDT
ncbi:unnamed protein product [Didymodactylos carnosus]|uniref:Tudor domain-containing protein n=1 Tax=Didymodactylos carnosus TaxID=1234261 RepID=A0A813W428_9BILA|nr:unnamed protein product [Didymodactylos carnosus]CAF3639699.1 unnamed protein product [Didymodactylos carnosus]